MTPPQIHNAPTLRHHEAVTEGACLARERTAGPFAGRLRRLLVGLIGEREFTAALFPGYVGELRYAGFVSGDLDKKLETPGVRARTGSQHMNTEHVSVPEGFSDVGLAESFLHHRVLVVPVERGGRPIGVVTRMAFFRHLVDRVLDRT